MKEPQRDRARAVTDATEQLAAAAKRHFRQLHLSLDDRAIAGLQRTHRHDARAILVAQRQQEQQILNRRDTQLRQPRRQCLAHAFQRGDGEEFGGCVWSGHGAFRGNSKEV